MTPQERAVRALNKLAKWRSVLAGWQLGTRSSDDPECQAVREHREATLILRAEVSALTSLILAAGLVSAADLADQLALEARALEESLEQRFPGIRATDDGILMDARAAEAMRGWRR